MEMMDSFDVVVIGAGPAGSAAAIAAVQRGLRVALLESGRYPRHKVCGEFVSAEAAEVLRHLLPEDRGLLEGAQRIRFSRLHSAGHSVFMPLAEPAYSIPRILLDETLWRVAAERSVHCIAAEARSVRKCGEHFELDTSGGSLRTRSVINASGRWSRITQKPASGESWVGLKAHFKGPTDDAVDLYFVDHGYCGVQAVSPGVLNACALVKQGSARNLEEIFQSDPLLGERSRGWTQITETFATAPVHLGLRTPLENGIVQVGDAAGFVDPFVGDGISLALRSGVLAGRSVLDFPSEEYARLYLKAFSGIFRNTRLIRRAIASSNAFRPWLLHTVRMPAVARKLFRSTRISRLDVLSPSLPRVN